MHEQHSEEERKGIGIGKGYKRGFRWKREIEGWRTDEVAEKVRECGEEEAEE